MSAPDGAARPDPGGSAAIAFPGVLVRFVTRDPVESARNGARNHNPFSAWSAWPGHPAIQPPLPRLAKADALAAEARDAIDTRKAPALAPLPAARPLRRVAGTTRQPRPIREAVTLPARPATTVARPTRARTPRRPVETLAWPASFDEWMIDIVKRRALRLNSGARRRGVGGSVRAVELAHILDRSVDADGHWLCALCHEPVTLDELSFDHVVALADGGEHAAHNLVPAHRKCNEVKGSEKAQSRMDARERWLAEWAGAPKVTEPSGVTQYAQAYGAREAARRYA